MNNTHHTEMAPNQMKVTCPACSLLCDDIVVKLDEHQQSMKVIANGCAKSIQFFEQTVTDSKPTINGNPVDLNTAINKAAEILKLANQPLIAGLGTEVQGMRAIMHLADKTGATLDHMHSDATMRNTLVLQNSGWQTTTLTEVKNRVDLLLVIGTDIVSSLPQFFERIIWNESTLFEQDTSTREVIYLGGGKGLDTSAGISPNGTQPSVINCENAQLPEVIATLNALINGKNLTTDKIAGINLVDLQSIADRLKCAKYSVITWASSAFKFGHSELLVQAITECVRTLNTGSFKFSTRSAGLPLTSGDGDSSVSNVATWMSGYPLRSSFKRGYPEYNPYEFTTEKLLSNNEADLLIWISSFKPVAPSPNSLANHKLPVIVIGHPNMQFEQQPDVFIPVRILGLQEKGLMFRMDSSVTLPLTQIMNSNLPSLSDVCTQIELALNNHESGK